MRYNDLLEDENDMDYTYDVTDQRSRDIDDTRMPILTLEHLNKLRKMREAKKLEIKTNRDLWAAIYGSQGENNNDEIDF